MEIVHDMKACTYLHETRNIEVIMAENVPKLMAYTKEHTREAQRTPSRINTKKKKNLLPGTTYSKYRKPKTKNKGKILKESREQIYFHYRSQSTCYSYKFPFFNKFSCEFLHFAYVDWMLRGRFTD